MTPLQLNIARRYYRQGWNQEEIAWAIGEFVRESNVWPQIESVGRQSTERPPMLALDVKDRQDVNTSTGTTAQTALRVKFGKNLRTDAGWSTDGLVHQFTGDPDRVRVYLDLLVQIDDRERAERPNQVVWIENLNTGWFTKAATGYIRDASDHETSSYNPANIDPAPGANPKYVVLATRESSNRESVYTIPNRGKLSFEAVL